MTTIGHNNENVAPPFSVDERERRLFARDVTRGIRRKRKRKRTQRDGPASASARLQGRRVEGRQSEVSAIRSGPEVQHVFAVSGQGSRCIRRLYIVRRQTGGRARMVQLVHEHVTRAGGYSSDQLEINASVGTRFHERSCRLVRVSSYPPFLLLQFPPTPVVRASCETLFHLRSRLRSRAVRKDAAPDCP
jgi:hypothetical protein